MNLIHKIMGEQKCDFCQLWKSKKKFRYVNQCNACYIKQRRKDNATGKKEANANSQGNGHRKEA